MNRSTPFPHYDIPDEPREPRVTAALSSCTRDDPEYRRLTDHDVTGLFHGGPKGETNPLIRVQGFTFCAISAATPDGERKQQVTYKGRENRRRRAEDPEPGPVHKFAYVGKFTGPRKPAASGRKRKVA